MIQEQFNEWIEVVFTLCANTFKSVSAVERTLYTAEYTFFDGGEESFLFNFCKKFISLAQNLLSTLLDYSVFLELNFISDMSAVVEDISCIFN